MQIKPADLGDPDPDETILARPPDEGLQMVFKMMVQFCRNQGELAFSQQAALPKAIANALFLVVS